MPIVLRDFWLHRLQEVWKRAPIAWLAGVRRVGKTTLTRSLPEAEYMYVNCDSPRAVQLVADPEFFFEQLRQPIVTFDEIHQLPDPTRLLKIGADMFPGQKIVATGSSTLAGSKKFSGLADGSQTGGVPAPGVVCGAGSLWELYGGSPAFAVRIASGIAVRSAGPGVLQ